MTAVLCELDKDLCPPNTPSRLESFSDGVIAVIITIMVLEFKLPQEPGPKAFISDVIPTLAVYLLSFTYTGIYWINHHHLVNRTPSLAGSTSTMTIYHIAVVLVLYARGIHDWRSDGHRA